MRDERGLASERPGGGPAFAVWAVGLVVVVVVPVAAILNSWCGFMVLAGATAVCDRGASDRANTGALIMQGIGLAAIWVISFVVLRRRRFASGVFWSIAAAVVLIGTLGLVSSMPSDWR